MTDSSDIDLPLLFHADDMTYTLDGRCPVCNGGFSSGFAYISGGALLLSDDRQNGIITDRLEGFLNVGFHGIDPDMTDSSDAVVVDELHGGQYDLNWCSVKCMRDWWNKLFDRIEQESSKAVEPI